MSTKQAFDSAMVEVQKTLQARIDELEVLKAKGAELARNHELLKVRVEHLVVLGARVAELERVLNELHACILAGAVTGAITDTLWVGPGRTAVDAIEHALRLDRVN